MPRIEVVPRTFGTRVELATELRGRPCAVVAWFAPPEPDVGIARPPLITALAVDPDGIVYEPLERAELEPLLPQLRARAEALLEAQPC